MTLLQFVWRVVSITVFILVIVRVGVATCHILGAVSQGWFWGWGWGYRAGPANVGHAHKFLRRF